MSKRFKPNPRFPEEQLREARTRSELEKIGKSLEDEINGATAMSGWAKKSFVEVTGKGVTVGTKFPLAHFDEWGNRNWSGTQPIRRVVDSNGMKLKEKGKP